MAIKHVNIDGTTYDVEAVNIYNGLDKTAAGDALDARQGKALKDLVDAKIPSTEKGAASGVATLGTDGKVPAAQLPSYVDDVLEYASLSNFPSTGETGKIYVALDTNKDYRWSGSTYVELSKYDVATQSASGLMSATDKTKLDQLTPGTFTIVGFSITPSDWTLSSGVYTYTFSNSGIGVNTTEDVYFEESVNDAVASRLSWGRDANTIVFSTPVLPIGNVVGTIRILGSSSEQRIVEFTGTTIPITKGGTGAANAAGARSNLGLGNVENKSSAMIRDEITQANVNSALGTGSGTAKYYREDGTWAVPPDTTYSTATTASNGLMSSTDKTKLNGIAEGATANVGTITGITMNGASKGTSGVVDLGTVITDVSGKKNTQTAVTDPTASGTALSFIDSISQDAQGVITPTKKSVAVFQKFTAGNQGAPGLVPAPARGDDYKVLTPDGWKYQEYPCFSKTVNGSENGYYSSNSYVLSQANENTHIIGGWVSDPTLFATDITATFVSEGNMFINYEVRAGTAGRSSQLVLYFDIGNPST